MARMSLTVVYWRDIPAQVIAKRGRESAKVVLEERFEHAIDRAAMRSGSAGSDAYLEDWRRLAEPCGDGDLQDLASARAAQLEQDYDPVRLERLIKSSGRDDQ